MKNVTGGLGVTPLDLTGNRFGLLIAIAPFERRNGQHYWTCQCDCGERPVVRASHLNVGATKSCGCMQRSKDGLSDTRAYHIWRGMMQRCYDNNHKAYKNYGGRGISVCERWHTFSLFYIDMGEPPLPFSIDRVNNDGNYDISNCRWATKQEQACNTRINHLITHNGITRCASQWAEEFGINRSTLETRIRNGWPEEQWFIPPTRSYKYRNTAKKEGDRAKRRLVNA